jgi:hypothetical protein
METYSLEGRPWCFGYTCCLFVQGRCCKMTSACSSKTSVYIYQITRCQIRKDSNIRFVSAVNEYQDVKVLKFARKPFRTCVYSRGLHYFYNLPHIIIRVLTLSCFVEKSLSLTQAGIRNIFREFLVISLHVNRLPSNTPRPFLSLPPSLKFWSISFDTTYSQWLNGHGERAYINNTNLYTPQNHELSRILNASDWLIDKNFRLKKLPIVELKSSTWIRVNRY